MAEALLKVGKDPAFRKDWQDVVLEEHAVEQMSTGKEVLEDVKVYTDWLPEIMSMKRKAVKTTFSFLSAQPQFFEPFDRSSCLALALTSSAGTPL